jgi:predicted alpha/beta hydrolase family esterase
MKNALIFHGTDCTPDEYWYGWIAEKLRDKWYTAVVPYYPEINHEPIENFLPKVLNNHIFNTETVLIGHSAGVPLILSLLESIDTKIAHAVLVAGFFEGTDPVLQANYNWYKIRANAHKITIINSDNDPWGCDDKVGKSLQEKIGGELIIKQEWHFGSWTYNQPYPTFELLNNLF